MLPVFQMQHKIVRWSFMAVTAVFALILCLSGTLQAQTNTATMFGTITDSTGAVLPGAIVKLVQTDTNFTRTSTTKADGYYREEFLPIGPYKITVSAPGFKAMERSGVSLSVMQVAEVSLSLEIGEATELITVTADAPLINTANSTLGGAVSNEQIDNFALINRDAVTRLLQTVPGVQSVSTVNNLGYQEVKALINGSTDGFVGQVSYYLDGGLNMTGLRNSGNQTPNPDAISQFNVSTNNFSAQVGRFAAGVVSVATKSGTNQYHGSVFEFYRSRNFNAVAHNQTTKGAYNRNQGGATFGGHFRHDKDFFFGSFGIYRFRQSGVYTGNVPSAAQMRGDFSENTPTTAEQASCAVAPSSAANAAFHFLVCNPTTHTPYPGNKLPTVDPTAVNILKYMALAINPTVSTDTRYSHREYDPLPENNEEYLIKTDHQITPKHRVTLSYFLLNYNVRNVASTVSQKWSYSNYANKQQNANISETWQINDSAINQLWLGYTRQNGGRTAVPSSTIADFGSDFGVIGTPSRSNIAIGGWFTLGQAITGPKAGTNLYTIRDVFNWTKGKHTLYLGAEGGLEKDFQLTSLTNYGNFTFSTTANTRTGNAMSDFMAGIPQSMAQDTGLYAQANYFTWGAFAQDDWRILPRLTLNLGVRYDVQQAPTDPYNRQTNFVAGQQSHAFTNVSIIGKTGNQLAPLGLQFPGDPGVPKAGVFTPYNHMSPRAGFAWDTYGNGRTVVHGAAGLFFGGISGNQWEFPSNFAPYAVRNTYSKVVSLTHPYQNDPTEFPTGTNPYPQINFTPGSKSATFLPLTQVVAFDPNYRWPMNYQFNFGIQQDFGHGLALSMYYVASLNRKQPLYNDINAPIFNITAAGANGASCTDLTKACGYANTSGTANNRRPLNSQNGLSAANPTFSNVWIIRSNQTSNYNGLQLNVEKRLWQHFAAKGYFTWSKTLQSNALDSTSGLNGTFIDANYPKLENGQRSDQDRRKMMTMSFSWSPDYYHGDNKITRTALNGWMLTGIWTANSGQPFTITTGTDINGDGQNNDRPSVKPGMTPTTFGGRRSRAAVMQNWFNTAAFCVPGTAGCTGTGPLNLLGNVRPALLDDPGFRMVDLSLVRTFVLHNALKFQVRCEGRNAFNLTNLGAPQGAMNNANYNKITGSGGDNRILQLGGRITF